MTNGWQTVQLGDVLQRVKTELTIDDSVTYKQVTVRLWNKGVVLRGEQEGLTIKTKRQFYVKTGQLLMSRIDVRNGAIGLVPKELDGAIVSNDFWAYDFDENKLFPKFLSHYVTTPSFIEDANRTSSGTTQRIRAEESAFLNIKIPLPPLNEQHRIVERIEKLSSHITKAQSLRDEADLESEVLLDTIVGKVFSELEAKEYKQLKEVTKKIGSGSTPSGGRAIYQQTGIPFIRSMNVRMRYFAWDNIAHIEPSIHENMAGTWVKPNDVLLNITGASIGRVACAPSDLVAGNVNQHVAIIRPVESLDSQYLMYWLSQPAVQDFINDEQKGATRQGFTKAQIEKFEIPIVPLDEQRRIVAYLDSVQARLASLRELQSATGEELSALLPSVLDRAFKGEL